MDENFTTDMSQSSASQELLVTFEILTVEGQEDPALIGSIGNEAVTALQQEGHYIARSSAYTGQKGAESFLVELIVLLQQTATVLHDHHTAISEGITDLSSLITIFTNLLPLFKQTQQKYEKHVGKEESKTRPIKITTEIDGAPIAIEAPDIEQAEAAMKLARKYFSAHPTVATHVTAKSKVKVRSRVPARKRRSRR